MKCEKCKQPQEEVWMFGGFGNIQASEDKREYCKNCFDRKVEEYGLNNLISNDSEESQEKSEKIA